MEKIVVESFYGNEEVTISSGLYKDGTIAIDLWCEEGPYASLTVCLDLFLKKESKKAATEKGIGIVDTNNCPWAPAFIEKYDLGKPTGLEVISGWCMYPEYIFNMEKIHKLSEF